MRIFKKIINRMLYPHCYSNDSYVKFLKSKGINVGDNTYFFSPKTTTIDIQNGIFISIGSNCKITKGCTILAHDYSYSVFRKVYHDIPKKAAETIIGNNVFIGINSIILMGSHIGNNVIIGAGSVVSGNIPDNQVWGGNPARYICSLDEYYLKCKSNFEEGAKITVNQYISRLNRYPSILELQYFSLLFLNNDLLSAEEQLKKMSFNGDNKNDVIKDCLKIKPKYNSYNEMIEKFNSQEKK